MNVAIVGCGLIGQKRARALAGARLVVCADKDRACAETLARGAEGCAVTTDWRAAVDRPDVQIVVVATPHNSLAEIAAGAIQAGKHVLLEKPAARHVAELRPLLELAKNKSALVRVGFNHRYHRAFQQGRKLIDSGALGPLMFLRARYGHGGRIGYDKEWRAQPALSGGGELIDQGVHLIDLARWFLGDFTEVDGYAHTYYWDMPVDDNAFLMLKTAHKQVAFLHASCTEWKNTFSMEVYGRHGKLHFEGLGGSYGVERLTYYKMLPEMGPPETTVWEFPMGDNSWELEMTEFLDDVRLRREPAAGLSDAVAALEIVDKIYRESGYDHRA
jgi:predicted dehydrogenase